MELNENARIDTSQIDDVRSSGGGGGGGIGGLPIGGGGITGIIITVLLAVVGGFFGVNQLGGTDGGTQTGDNTSLSQECSQADAVKQLDCRNVLYVNSIQDYWKDATPQYFNGDAYKPAKTVFFSNAVRTGCGSADSGVGPFYCSPSRTCWPTSTATTSRTWPAPRRPCAASSSATRIRRTRSR
jgi:predicted metalloprotease